ncbi:J domain-containing protein [Thermodesulfobacteriota bacterium]
MDIQKCFNILELRQDATPEEACQAYRDLAAIWHPDRCAHNPRLQQKAEEKLKEINVAYEQVKSFLTMKQVEGLQVQAPGPARAEPGKPAETTADKKGVDEADLFSATTAPRVRPKIGPGYFRLIGIVVLILVIPTLFFSISILEDIRQKAARPADIFGQSIQQALRTLEQEAPKTIETARGEEKSSVVESRKGTKKLPAKPKKYIQIHLKNGSIILTTAYWEENSMIMFKETSGVIGVERSRVKKIVHP